MRALSSRPVCSCDGRRVSPRYLSAAARYTTVRCRSDEMRRLNVEPNKREGESVAHQEDRTVCELYGFEVACVSLRLSSRQSPLSRVMGYGLVVVGEDEL